MNNLRIDNDMHNPEKNWCFWLSEETFWKKGKQNIVSPMIFRAWALAIPTEMQLFSKETDPEKRQELVNQLNRRIWRTIDDVARIMSLSQMDN
jgi:hypothetical protein